MIPYELSTLELEHGNFDRALASIKAKARAGDQLSIRLLAKIYQHGIGIQKDESESMRLLHLIEKPVSHSITG